MAKPVLPKNRDEDYSAVCREAAAYCYDHIDEGDISAGEMTIVGLWLCRIQPTARGQRLSW